MLWVPDEAVRAASQEWRQSLQEASGAPRSVRTAALKQILRFPRACCPEPFLYPSPAGVSKLSSGLKAGWTGQGRIGESYIDSKEVGGDQGNHSFKRKTKQNRDL